MRKYSKFLEGCCSIVELINSNLDKAALADSIRIVMYNELIEKICGTSKNINVLTGNERTLCICLEHSIEYVICVLACIEAGCKIYVLHPNCADGTLIEFAVKKIPIITSNINYEKIKDIYGDLKDLVYLFENLVCCADIDLHKSWDFVSSVIFSTSGTTSLKTKYVCIPFKNILLKSKMLIESLGINVSDINLLISPLCFIQSMWTLIIHLLCGATVFVEQFRPKSFFEILETHKITTLITTPSIIRGLVDRITNSFSLRLIGIGGDNMDETSLQKLRYKWGDVLYSNIYGTTETAAADVLFSPRPFREFDHTYLSVGKKTMYSEIFILDEHDEIAEANNVGVVCIQSPFIQDYYYESEQRIKSKNGYYITNDIGYINETGYLFFCGRLAGIIVYNGQKISSYEIENILYEKSEISEVIVIGEKHEIFGEIPVCYLTIKNPISENDLRQYLMKRVEKYKIPHRFTFVDKLNKTNSGKIIRAKEVYLRKVMES